MRNGDKGVRSEKGKSEQGREGNGCAVKWKTHPGPVGLVGSGDS